MISHVHLPTYSSAATYPKGPWVAEIAGSRVPRGNRLRRLFVSLVDQQHALVRCTDVPAMIGSRVGESALPESEMLADGQLTILKPCAIDRDCRIASPRTRPTRRASCWLTAPVSHTISTGASQVAKRRSRSTALRNEGHRPTKPSVASHRPRAPRAAFFVAGYVGHQAFHRSSRPLDGA